MSAARTREMGGTPAKVAGRRVEVANITLVPRQRRRDIGGQEDIGIGNHVRDIRVIRAARGLPGTEDPEL